MKIKFKRDTAFRKQFFVPESFAHPAKMDAQLLIWIVEHYSKEGETILDPMAGSGTSMLACTLGRDVVLVELEEKFCKMMWDNWEVVKTRPQLGSTMGECQIINGDARNLGQVLNNMSVDKIVTSPPYAEAHDKDEPDSWGGLGKDRADLASYRYIKEDNADNIANLAYGQIDKIVTSPPYENNPGTPSLGSVNKDDWGRQGGDIVKRRGLVKGYDGIEENIGNLKSQSYLEAMLQVYQQCYKVLKPQGLMILVTKNFIRNKQVVRLDEDTIKLCEQAGFNFVERHYRKLPSLSFWRVTYAKKYPDLKHLIKQLWYEDILVFKK